MRYQSPGIEAGLNKLKKQSVGEIVVVPLFPQYASASTGSVIQKVNEIVNEWQTIPDLKFVSNFLDHPMFIDAFAENARRLMEKQEYEYVVFSYHGLPERQILKGSDNGYCQLSASCCAKYGAKNKLCYRAQCYETSRLLAAALNLSEDGYTTTFQSRLGKNPWIKPYTDVILQDLPGKGKKKVLVFSPAFIADCLETSIEVGEQFKNDFIASGGEIWDLVPSLNNEPKWIECLEDLVRER
jgi:ferrochelatase